MSRTDRPGEVGATHGVAQPGEHGVGISGDEHLRAVTGRIRVGRSHTRQGATGSVAQHTGDVVVDHRRLHERSDRLVDRDVDFLAEPALSALVQRSERADHREHGCERVAEAHTASRRRTVGVAGGVADATDGLADRSEPGFGRSWSTLAEAGHVRDDDPRVRAGERCVVEAELGQHARPEVLEDDVALGGETLHEREVVGVLEVGHDGSLVAGDDRPPQAGVVDAHPPVAHRVTVGTPRP